MFSQLTKKLAGHLWTIAPTIRHRIAPRRAPEARQWSHTLVDPTVGDIEIRGLHRHRPGSDTLVCVVHGLGGHCDSVYAVDAAIAVEEAGFSCLRLCLRGAQGTGEDIYHAGLTDDLHAALSDEAFATYDHLLIIGFSLGGHVALRTAVEGADPRLRAVAAVCPPLDLRAVQQWLDAPARTVYREYILRELRDMYAAVAARGRAPTSLERVRQVRTLYEWDALTVAPRHGFADPDDYYRQMSVGSRLGDLRTPALLIASHHDPMIPSNSVEPLVRSRPERLDICWVDEGGHVFFPPALDAGLGNAKGVAPQALQWLAKHI